MPKVSMTLKNGVVMEAELNMQEFEEYTAKMGGDAVQPSTTARSVQPTTEVAPPVTTTVTTERPTKKRASRDDLSWDPESVLLAAKMTSESEGEYGSLKSTAKAIRRLDAKKHSKTGAEHLVKAVRTYLFTGKIKGLSKAAIEALGNKGYMPASQRQSRKLRAKASPSFWSQKDIVAVGKLIAANHESSSLAALVENYLLNHGDKPYHSSSSIRTTVSEIKSWYLGRRTQRNLGKNFRDTLISAGVNPTTSSVEGNRVSIRTGDASPTHYLDEA